MSTPPSNNSFSQIETILLEMKQQQHTDAQALESVVKTKLQAVITALGPLATLVAQGQQEIDLLEQLVVLLTPPPPGPAVKFDITVTSANNSQGENDMAKQAAKIGKLKISILDNGTAVATITGVVDAAGLPTTFESGTVPTYVCETTPGAGQDPSIVLTPAADGMSCGIAPSTPPALVTGDTLTVTAAQPTQGSLTQTYSPVAIVAGPANTFVVSVQ